ncbi:MAG: restriction endonuclease [Pseudomonadota bacterium]
MSEALISLAIEQLTRTDFELWCQEVLTQDKGYAFEPTGGIHDGGQDGFIRTIAGETDHYVQISKEAGTSAKIRKTIRRLRESRNVKKLTYLTSQTEAERDLIEAKIKHDLSVDITIHDQRWLLIQAKINERAKDSLFSYSRELLDSYKSAQAVDRKFDLSSRLSIVSYLEAHVKSLPGTESFQVICLDTLIYNALVGTNPETETFMTPDEIEQHIREEHPNVLSKAECSLADRLAFLSSKQNDPRIRRHPNERYALPYSLRNSFHEDNLRLQAVADRFVGSINKRLNELSLPDSEEIRSAVITWKP